MSAPLRDPLVVNTQDNRCWVRRAWSQDGHGLYGLEGTPADAEQTLLSLRELAEYGLRSLTDVLPMPVGSPDALTRAFAPTQVLRDEDEFGLHHEYRVPRDLPEMGGQR